MVLIDFLDVCSFQYYLDLVIIDYLIIYGEFLKNF